MRQEGQAEQGHHEAARPLSSTGAACDGEQRTASREIRVQGALAAEQERLAGQHDQGDIEQPHATQARVAPAACHASTIGAATRAGASSCARCPSPGRRTSRAPRMRAAAQAL